MKIEIPNIKLLQVNDYVQNYFKANIKMPRKYIINKGATILFWDDNSKTVVRRNKEDKHDYKLAFLTAYFQKHCGLSKNKANKYLDNLIEEEKGN